jgi:hypothetical protein
MLTSVVSMMGFLVMPVVKLSYNNKWKYFLKLSTLAQKVIDELLSWFNTHLQANFGSNLFDTKSTLDVIIKQNMAKLKFSSKHGAMFQLNFID